MCSTPQTNIPLIISTICSTDPNDNTGDENIHEFNNTSCTIINNYLTANHHEQLSNGGYRDSKYKFNCKDFFPIKKQFFIYKGSTFRTNSSDQIKNITRVVFEEPLIIPYKFYLNIKALTQNPNCDLKGKDTTDFPINKFIEPYEKHIPSGEDSIIYSETDIDFTSDTSNTNSKKKSNVTTLYTILILFVLFLLIVLFFTWKEGILKNALKEIFKENEVLYSIISRYI